MRRLWIACVALVLLSGCAFQATGAQGVAYKKAFLQVLIGNCAKVDHQLGTFDNKSHPGRVAEQLSNFAAEARSRRPPNAQRHQLDALLTKFDEAAKQFRTAQAALSSGKAAAAQAAENQGNRTMAAANTAAQRYGMPPLSECPKHVRGAQQSAPPARVAGAWRSGHASPFGVQYAAAAVLNGRIWVAGGLIGPKHATTKTEFYDPTLDTWTPGPLLPIALHHATMVSYRNTLYLIGGFVPQGGNVLGAASARVLVLNKTGTDWLNGPSLHHARAAGAAAVVGGKIVVVGGRTGNSQQLVKPTEIFDGTSWHDAAAIPDPVNHLAAASDGTYLYAVGGHKITETSNITAVQRFNPATGAWTQLKPMPTAVSGLGAAVVGGRLITAGGDNAIAVFNTVQAYDLTTKTWSPLPSLPQARTGMGLVTFRNVLYSLDGAAKPGHIASTNTVQILNFNK
jgi:hypothetical protein